MKLHNKYYIMRHGQAVSNVKNIVSCWPEKFKNPLTSLGREKVEESAKKIIGKNIDLIFSSDLLRTKQTAEIVGKFLGIKPIFDKRLREQNSGVFNGESFQNLKHFFGERGLRRFKIKPQKGETYIDIKKRMVNFLKSTDKKYRSKNILIVSHGKPIDLLEAAVRGISNKDFYNNRIYISVAEVQKLN